VTDPSLQRRLIEFLDQLTSATPVTVGPDTAIFEISLFDSLALVELVTWVENEIGEGVDLSDVDFRTEWRTVAHIVEYVERARTP
jgi:D-alanine--poly(phosphoribitol) ligase subunit 2